MERLDINPRILIALKKAKISTFGQVLSMSAPDLERATQLTQGDIEILKNAVATKVKDSPPVSALKLYKKDCPEVLQMKYLTCLCPVIDSFLRGGIPTRGITEIAGESAAGKTQFCIQLSMACQLSRSKGGLDAGCVYICTEDVFPNKRMIQMVTRYQKQNNMEHHNFTDKVYIEHASELKDLSYCISKKVPFLLSSGKVRLVVIDSIAALFRCEFEANETVQRAKELSSFAAKLHAMSHQYSVPIICVNQVSDVFDSNPAVGKRKVKPALGLAWSNLVTTRLMLTKTNESVELEQLDNSNKDGLKVLSANVRQMEVMFAPHLPNRICKYVIDSDGVKGISLT